MASNNNNNAALWRNIKKIKKTIKNYKHYAHWVDLLSCEVWNCKEDKDGKNQPILNENGKLPESRIEKLEEILGSSDSDTDSVESLGSSDSDTDLVDSLDEEIQKLKDEIIQLNARAEHYATKQELDEVAQLGRDNQEQLDIHGGEIADLEARADELETDRHGIIDRIERLEGQRSGTGGTGGGKRRKRTRGKKRTKKRRKSKGRKRRKSRRKKRGKKKTKKRRRKRRKKKTKRRR